MDLRLQTQRYSSLLAQRLGNTNTTNASATPAASEGGPSQPVLQANEQPLLLGSGLDAAADDSVPAQQPVSHAQPMDEDAGSDGDDAQQGDWMSEDGAERIEEDAADRDYAIRAGDHEQVDDEATLEEEEALEEAAGAPDRSRELADLENEAEMPLEQLLASYGFIMGADDEQPKDEPAVNVDQQPEPEDADLDAMASDSDEGAAVQGGDDSADNEYTRDAESEPDDEATLDEEELAAQAHGEDRQAAEAAELAELQAEADLPIEALLARYGHLREGPEAAGGEAAAAEAGAADVASAMDVDPAEPAAAGGQAAAVKDKEQPPASAKGKPKMSKNRDDESVPEGLVTGGSSGERMEGAAAMAVAAQPTGHTLQTTKVGTEVPFLLKGSLREYQHIGLDWLVTIYRRRLNGILADEMGLGKTIMTIALLGFLACEEGVWGPHLVVVPTSVMLNWEMEFKKWCPAFKLLTYYGSARERAAKRQGWSKPNAFHICITSYNLILSDAKMFRRKRWKYLILDEAHMIKNWKSQRWQTLLNFNSKRRLLITGTPLQNDLMELWSLMHFLMPQVFASHAQFKDWFHNPLLGMVEGETINKGVVDRLHGVLRPFLLRRLKSEVETQLPHKHEHVLRCRLSRRQRALYEDYMASSETRNRLSSGGFLGILNVLMQLRKVCNHPDLFEAGMLSSWEALEVQALALPEASTEPLVHLPSRDPQRGDDAYGMTLKEALGFSPSPASLHAVDATGLNIPRRETASELYWRVPDALMDLVKTAEQRAHSMDSIIREFMFAIPKARSPRPVVWCSHPDQSRALEAAQEAVTMQSMFSRRGKSLATAIARKQLFFPDRRLIQFDCGKLQELEGLLRGLRSRGSRALIFTQMARMLDILEVWLNLHAFPYLRLDGSTKPEQRQALMQRFNTNPKLLVFILSTRSGGVGMNLTGADTVIFYDSDWNPAMDAQAQDRCHRIGQTREVHIYRLVSERTVEENILSKSDQKRQLDYLAIQSGGFNTDFLQKINPADLLGGMGASKADDMRAAMRAAEDENDAAAAAAAERETAAELAEFSAEPAPGTPAADADGPGEGSMAAADGEGRGTSPGADNGRQLSRQSPPSGSQLQAAGSRPSAELADEDTDMPLALTATAAGAGGNALAALAQLENSLRPVERYAVRFLEQSQPVDMDVEAVTAAVEQELDAQEWNMQEMERQQQEQEEEMDEEGEAVRLSTWDKAAADAAFQAQRAQALEQQAALEAQLQKEAEEMERLALEQMYTLPPEPVLPQVTKSQRNKASSRTAAAASASALEEAESPRHWEGFTRKKRSRIAEDASTTGEETASWQSKRGRGGQDLDLLSGATKRRRSSGMVDGPFLRSSRDGSGLPNMSSPAAGGTAAGPAGSSLSYWLPWEALEDLVLCAVVVRSCEGATTAGRDGTLGSLASPDASAATTGAGRREGDWHVAASVWETAAQALAAGADQLSMSAAHKAINQGMRRPAADCQARYLALLRAQVSAQSKAGSRQAQDAKVQADLPNGGPLDDLAALRRRLAALIACRKTCQRQVMEQKLAEAGAQAASDQLPGNGGSQALSGSAESLQALLADVDLLWQMAQEQALDAKHCTDPTSAPQPHQPAVVPVQDALRLFEAVRKGAGHPARGVLRYLGAVMSALQSGGITAAFKALLEQIQATPATEAALAGPQSPDDAQADGSLPATSFFIPCCHDSAASWNHSDAASDLTESAAGDLHLAAACATAWSGIESGRCGASTAAREHSRPALAWPAVAPQPVAAAECGAAASSPEC
ncbi:hypothetical protein WJX73_009601 [Symbiochloris irregularis]|uniref:Uncharacterized protein n=1 Tax=Symbiochloris irregularis TaxID=706552 RepID=A0AAW1NNU6_9CHLO